MIVLISEMDEIVFYYLYETAWSGGRSCNQGWGVKLLLYSGL